MRVEREPDGDGWLCWLSQDELNRLIGEAENERESVALSLMGHSGLRVNEARLTRPQHLSRTPAGDMVTVPAENAKNGEERQTVVSAQTAGAMRMVESVSGDPIYQKSKRTLQRRVKACAEAAGIDNHDRLSAHDLRRTFATLLRELGIDDNCIMRWGGWQDPQTYWEHYVGAYTPDFEKEQRAKVDWL